MESLPSKFVVKISNEKIEYAAKNVKRIVTGQPACAIKLKRFLKKTRKMVCA